MAQPQGKPDTGATSPSELQAGQQLGPYRVERFMARGGMAEVYAAQDTRTDEPVAIKLLRPLDDDPAARRGFRREFRALSRLNHPNVLRVYEWGLHGHRPWFSMERVPGHDLSAEVRGWEDLPPQDRFTRAQAILVQLARALDHVHDRGLVHRDLTPANVLIRPDGLVKLTDFGVVRDLSDERAATEVRGTAAWIAPEQALSQPVDARTDLYALGALLYLMLTGRRPFTARSVQGFIDKHVHEVPRRPIELDPRVPPHLDAIAVRLLQKRPQDRFASASHLLHVLGELDPLDDTEHWPPRLVGRTVLRAHLRALLDRVARQREGGVVLVQGAPGQGKTRILDVAESQARRRGITVARAESRPSDGPFGTFVNVLEDLAPDQIPDVIRAALLGEGDRPRERYPVLSAFRPLLADAAPAVLILDDLHLADGASLDLLEYLVRNTLSLAHEPVLFVLGEEVEGDGPTALQDRLEPLGVTVRERLGPLARSEVEELLLSLLAEPRASEALAARLHDETQGSPAFLADMLRGLVDEGLIVQEDGRWRIVLDPTEITRSSLPMPASLRQALTERLAPLPDNALDVGRTLAVARRPIELDVLLQASSLDEEPTVHGLDTLVGAGIVQESRADDRELIELSHQRFRDVLLEEQTRQQRQQGHQRLGEVLERHHRRHPGRVVEELTFHFDRAGLVVKAYAYLRRTAQRRIDASLWDEALDVIDRAIRMEEAARPQMLLDDADRALSELLLGRSQSLYALGRSDEANADAMTAVRLAAEVGDPLLESRVLVEHGRQARAQGRLDDARTSIERALDRAEAAHDPALRTTPLYELGALAWADRDLQTAATSWRRSLETAQRVGDERAVAFGFNGLGILSFCNGQTMEARRHLEQSARLFEQMGLLAPLSIARTNLAELYHATGLLKKAQALAERTIQQSREVHHPLGIALGLTHRARVLAVLGRVDEAASDATEAVRCTVEVRSGEDELMARTTLARIACEDDRDADALEILDNLDELLAHDTQGLAAQVRALRALALARLGQSDQARQDLAGPTPEDWPNLRVPTELARGTAFRALDDTASARKAYQRALHLAEANGYRLYQLEAHDGLAHVVTEESTRARHGRVAGALARSLAASLPRGDGARFLARSWGGA